MSDFKWNNQEETKCLKKSTSQYFTSKSPIWQEMLELVEGGGQVDPWKTFDEWIADALSRLFAKHDSIIAENGLSDISKTKKEQTKYNGALRRETKGQASVDDIILLDNEDIIDSWFDNMESTVEGSDYGEQWIEDPTRTEQELIDYDPSVITWPIYPL